MALVQYDSVTTFEMTVNCGYFVRPVVVNKILGGIPGMSQGGC